MNPYVALGGYVLLFTIVSGLFRYEYEMPRSLSAMFASLLVVFAGGLALAGSVTGLASLPQISGATTLGLVMCVVGVSLLNDRGTPA